jgi:hypothetical protein
MDYFDGYVWGSGLLQMMLGFYFFAKFLHKKVRLCFYFLFALCGLAIICFVSASRIAEFGAYMLLLVTNGLFLCKADGKSVILYAALVVEVTQLCYGIVNSLSSVLYPLMSAFDQRVIGIAFMLLGDLASLSLAGFCCHMACRYFSYYEAVKKQYVFMVFIPILMLFFMDETINSIVYTINVTADSGLAESADHYQMLLTQLLGLASLFCVLFAYKKLLQNFRLSTELSLLEQEERSLIQYVEEAKTRYEKTKSFRHDIKNHLAVIKKLLKKGQLDQALDYIGDMAEITEELSFPCSTNNPVVDILVGNKLGIAKSMGIHVSCSLLLPYPCGLRDIDVCVILSNALDNAIRACENMEESAEKQIQVTGRVQGDFIFMEIENSFQGNGMFKKGTGLSNIKAITEKYHGAMSVKTQGGDLCSQRAADHPAAFRARLTAN